MSTIHLTNGDVAAESLRTALRDAGRDDRVHALRDDPAVGPLRGADDTPDVRAGFWDRVSTDTKRDFLREFREQAAELGFLVSDSIVLWRLRELSATRRIKLRGDASASRTLELCAAFVPCPH